MCLWIGEEKKKVLFPTCRVMNNPADVGMCWNY